MVIVLCFGIALGIAYRHSIVGKIVVIAHPRDDFQGSLIPGFLLITISLASVTLQIIFRIFVYFKITNNSNRSVIILLLSLLIYMLANANPNWLFTVSKFSSILKFFALPLEILYNNEEAKNYFKHNNPKVFNVIPITIQSLQFLKDKTIQFISLLKIKLLGPSNQVHSSTRNYRVTRCSVKCTYVI